MIGLFNPYFIGDSVMLEAIARKLSEKTEVAIISSYPELFIAHPVVKAYTLDDMPEDINLIDMANAIRGIKQVDGKNVYVENKIELMFQETQIGMADISQPELYLTPEEKEESKRLKGLNGGCNVGVVLESRHPEKDWAYMAQLVKSLTYKYHVHVIGQGIKDRYPYLKDLNITYIDNVSLRQLMVHISTLDMVVGVDTGPMHIAGALRIPTVVIGFEQYGYLYNLYKNCRYLNARDLKTINIRKVYKACKGILKNIKVKNIPVKAVSNIIVEQARKDTVKPSPLTVKNVAICRIRGIGDILLSLPAIKAYKNKYPHINIDYITDLDMVDIVKSTGFFRDVIGVKYNHPTAGYPELPPEINKSNYDHIYNLINKVDFKSESAFIPRIELFARELGVDDDVLERVPIQIPLLEYSKLPSGKVVVIQSDSNGYSRQWDIQRQLELCNLLKDDYLITVTGLRHNDSFPDYVNNVTGRLSMDQYFRTIAGASIVVSADSSAVHMAGCLGVDCIGLYGSIDPVLRTAHYPTVRTIIGKGGCVPCNDWQKSCCKDMKNMPMCLWSITARTVYNKILEGGK